MQCVRRTSEAGPVVAHGPTATSQLRAVRPACIVIVVALCTAVAVEFSLSHAKEDDVAADLVLRSQQDRVGGDGYHRNRDEREHPPARPREASDA